MVFFPAFCAMLAIGASDFFGAVSVRRTDLSISLLFSLVGGLMVLPPVRALFGAPIRAHDVLWASLAGLGSLGGLTLLRAGVTHSRLVEVAPVSALVAAVVSAAYYAETTETMSHFTGIGMTIAGCAAFWLWRIAPKAELSSYWTGALSGAGFALGGIGGSHVSADPGPWPIFVAQILRIGIVAIIVHDLWRRKGNEILADTAGWFPAFVAGFLALIGNACFGEAVSRGASFPVVSGLVAQHSLVSVLLATIALGEALSLAEAAALAATASSLVLLGQMV